MTVTYGRTCPPGHLPIFSVDTEEEARSLLILTCSRNHASEFIARELVNDDGSIPENEERLERFYGFGDRLRAAYAHMKRREAEAI